MCIVGSEWLLYVASTTLASFRLCMLLSRRITMPSTVESGPCITSGCFWRAHVEKRLVHTMSVLKGWLCSVYQYHPASTHFLSVLILCWYSVCTCPISSWSCPCFPELPQFFLLLLHVIMTYMSTSSHHKCSVFSSKGVWQAVWWNQLADSTFAQSCVGK